MRSFCYGKCYNKNNMVAARSLPKIFGFMAIADEPLDVGSNSFALT
jgi:hypothetical protein